MKKGCLGCLGCGCLLIILAVVIPSFMAWNWLDNDGRKIMADGIQKTVEEGSKFAFEPSSVAEIASLTKEIRDDVINKRIGLIDSWNYCLETIQGNDKLQSQLIFAVIYRNLAGKNPTDNHNPGYLDNEGAEAARAIMYAISQGNIDTGEVTSKVKPILDKNSNVKKQSGNSQFETQKVKKNVTKEDMEKVSQSLKEYIKANNIEIPDKSISPDELAKKEVIKFLEGFKKLKK